MYISQYQANKLYKQRERETVAYRAQRDHYLEATREEASPRRESVTLRIMRWLNIAKREPNGVCDGRLIPAV